MTVIEDEQSTTVPLAPPRTWDERLARVISNVGSPPMLITLVIGLPASAIPYPGAWRWASVYVFVAVLTPFLYLAWLVEQGKVTDLDVKRREQRTYPLLVTIVCQGMAWLLLGFGAAPSVLITLAATSWLQTLIILVITLRWKISVHTSAAAGAATVVWILLGTPLSLLIVPLIAWSRVRLRRHTLLQTVVGALLGFSVFIIALSLMQAG